MKVIAVLVALLVVGFVSVKLGSIYKRKGDLQKRVEFNLDLVDENSFDQVRQNLVADAKKLNIELDPATINIVYTDVNRAVGTQKYVDKLADFKNKQVAISLKYTERLLGFKLAQEITGSKIKQIQIRQKVRPEYDELLK